MTTGGALPQTVGFATTALSAEWDTVVDRALSGRSYDDAGSGAQRWRFTATWPGLLRDEWAPIRSFLARQRGPAGLFTVIPPETATPRGVLGGTPLINAPAVTNGGFDSDTNWTKGTGWSIGSGVATKTAGTSTYLTQTYPLVVGASYQITFTVTAYTAGQVRPALAGGASTGGTYRSAVGTYTETLVAATGNALIGFQADASFAGSIDDVSIALVGELLPVDGATASVTNWLRDGDVLVLPGHTKVYMVTADVDSDGSGNVAIPITPPLVASPADNETLTLTDVPLTVRQVSAPRWTTQAPMIGADYSVELEEAWQ